MQMTVAKTLYIVTLFNQYWWPIQEISQFSVDVYLKNMKYFSLLSIIECYKIAFVKKHKSIIMGRVAQGNKWDIIPSNANFLLTMRKFHSWTQCSQVNRPHLPWILPVQVRYVMHDKHLSSWAEVAQGYFLPTPTLATYCTKKDIYSTQTGVKGSL